MSVDDDSADLRPQFAQRVAVRSVLNWPPIKLDR